MGALPYTLALLVPADRAQLLGREQGRRARRAPEDARQHRAAGRLRADGDAADVARHRARLGLRDDPRLVPGLRRLRAWRCSRTWSLEFARQLPHHWILPFSALFLVAFGGWAIGMRNMIIYELEADYSNYLAALGAPNEARPQVRLPQRAAAADHRPRARARRGRRGRDRRRDRLLVSGPRHPDADGDPEPRLLPDPGHLPLPDRRRPDREPHHRHRLRLHRPAHAGRHAGRRVMAVPARARARDPRRPGAATGARARRAGSPAAPAHRSEFLYFALRNWKFVARRSALVLALLVLAIFGPDARDRTRRSRSPGPTDSPPSVRLLVRDDLVRPGRLLAVRPRPARGVPRRRRRRRHRLGRSARPSASPPATAAAGSTTS